MESASRSGLTPQTPSVRNFENWRPATACILLPIVIEIRIQDNVAYDYGWHVWKKASRDGSPQVTVKNRYVDIWRKNEKGEWKLWMYMNNTDVPTQMPNDG